ncbi:MAG: UDP-N-acetylmuramoyl-L-alanine--D-glutamate ligase [Longimicrobiales bacterium]
MNGHDATHGRPRGAALEGRKVAVLGLGASGRAAARLALSEGGEVYVSDLRADAQTADGGAELRALGADVEWGAHDVDRVARADLVVVSPGIPPHAPVLRALSDRGLGWISEPELAVRFFRGPLIAVTGTNGKTTTSVMIAHLLQEAGQAAALGGNVGGGLAPAASALALMEPAPAWYVLELSSFQLGAIQTLRPDLGVVTNLSPDHLDYYETVEDYYGDKARLFDNADERCRWVLPYGDAEVAALAGDAPGTRYYVADEPVAGAHAWVDAGVLTVAVDGEPEPLVPTDEVPLLGRHNHRNALVAALVARLAGATPDALARGLRTARALPHRLEPVLERRGILWVNDSKATNVAATASALGSLERPVVLLLGGKDKAEDFRRLRPALANVRAAVTYGAAGPRLADALDGAVDLVPVEGTFDQAVQAAADRARPGDIVLLSPACSSFDMFDNYEERGRRFAALAREVA